MVESVSESSPLAARFGQGRRYAILAYGSFGTMAGLGLMVLGSLLIGLSVAVLIGGFGFLGVTGVGLSTSEMLISAIVLMVVGLFGLGVAAEGPLGRGRRLVGFRIWEIGVGRVLAVFLAGLIPLLLYDFLGGLLEGVPAPFYKGVEGFRSVGFAGMTVMPLLGVPLSLAVRAAPDRYAWARQADIPLMFVVWAVATLFAT